MRELQYAGSNPVLITNNLKYNNMKLKVKELRNLPFKKWDEIKDYNELYVISSGKKHDSGWALMYIIGKNEDEIEIAAACDDICWDVSLAKKYDLRNDMTYPSGILRYWSNKFKFRVGASLSSTNVTLIEK